MNSSIYVFPRVVHCVQVPSIPSLSVLLNLVYKMFAIVRALWKTNSLLLPRVLSV